MKKWFQLPECAAGKKRLLLSYFLYKIFGSSILRIIAFFVSLSVFLFNKERRNSSIKFYKLIKKPPILSTYRQFFNYANSLVDKIISFSGNFDTNKFILKNDPNIYKGAFFITTHIGNIEILRCLIEKFDNLRTNIFLQGNFCETFNSFLKTLEIKVNADIFPVEEIDIETSIIISDRLKNGEIVFMAGDRISAQNENKIYEGDFLGKKIQLPLGTLKFALMMNVPIYFIVCAKEEKNYIVEAEEFISEKNKKQEKLDELKQAYLKFLEKYTLKYPYQFYNFYQMWD